MSSTMTNGKFIGLNDFYNYIKQSDGQNSPTNFYYFSVWFYPEGGTSYFNGKDLDRLRYAVQKVDLPKSILKGYENNQLVDATSSIDNLYGAYTFLRNAYFNTDSKTISIRFLNFQKPVIEEVIYPWYYNCVRNEWDTTTEYGTSFPKLSMVIRFWSGNNVSSAASSTSSHVFEYFVSGLFPITIEPYSPAQATGSDDNRSVSFAFNEFRAYIKGYASTAQTPNVVNPLSTPLNIRRQPQTPGATHPDQVSRLNGAQGKTLEDVKREQEQAAAAAAAAQKKQNVEAHGWLQNMVANAAGAAAGSAVKKNVTNNLITQLKNDSSKKNSSNNSNTSNNQMSLKDAQDKASNIKENVNKPTENQDSSNLNDKTNDIVNSGNMGSLTVDQVVNILNNEKNVSSNDSNMSLPENEMLVESMNVDNDFGLILDDTNESEQAYSETTEYTTEQDSVSNENNKNLESKDQVKSNPKTYNSVDNLSIKESTKSEKKETSSINDIDTSVDQNKSSNTGLSKDDLTNYSSEKEKTEKKEESKLSKDDVSSENKTKNDDETSKSNLNISDIVKSFNDNKNLKSKDDLNEVSTDMLNSISNNLSLGEISGSIDNMQKAISSYGTNLSIADASEKSNENEKTSSSIKSNLTLAESKTIVENISIDDEFGEIIDSDDELELATEERRDEYKNQNIIGTNKTIDEINETFENNSERLKTYVSESDLNLEKIKENYDSFINESVSNKNKVIQTKKEELDNFTTETTNEVKFGQVGMTADDVENMSSDAINEMKKESDLNLEKIKENYDSFINESVSNKNKVIQTKKEELDNFTTDNVSINKNEVIQTKKEELDNFTTETTNEVKYRKINDDDSSAISSSFKEIESLKTSKNLDEKTKLKTLSSDLDNTKSTTDVAKEYIEAVTTSKPNEIEIGRSKLPEYIKIRDDYYERLILATESIKENIDHIMNIIRRMDEEFGIILDTNELEEINKMFKDLQNNKRISVISYKHLNTYAENENLDITDVTKDYKTKTGSDLDSFIDNIIISNIKHEKNTITNSSLNPAIFLKDDQLGFKIEKQFKNIPQVHTPERIKEYNVEKMISNDDINDLFN